MASTATPTTSTINSPIPTDLIPNPMHQFASWTYSWSFWWIDVNDYNALMTGADAGTGLTLPLKNSYVAAEDSGLYSDQRLPTQYGLNYNIQDVEFDTLVGLNSSSKSSNMIEGSLTVVEPYGVTFIDSLITASFLKVANGLNYLTQPYMLQLDLTGYDDSGTPIPRSLTSIYRKRFPIKLTGVKINVTNKGAEYKISYIPVGHENFRPENSSVPKNLTVTAGTVAEFFDATNANSFPAQINAYWQKEVTNGKAQYANSIRFDIDPSINLGSIVYSQQMPLSQSNPNSKQIDLSKGNFSIPVGTQIIDVIQRVIAQSTYMQNQLGTTLQSGTQAQIQTSLTQILNTFKTTTQVLYQGTDSSGGITNAVFDNQNNRYPISMCFNIHQYNVYDANHPAAPLLSDARPYIVKKYDYLYTGKNIDVLDFKINFDTTWYTAIAGYTDQVPSTNVTGLTNVDSLLANQGVALLSPQLLVASGIFPNVASVTPLRYKVIVGDQRTSIGFNTINNPGSQTSADVMKSLYSRPSGDMVALDMTIVGDPTLIKQDDWLYIPSPTTSTNYLNNISQSQFASQYGHLRMDTGTMVVLVTINTPVDIDTDISNQGLIFPQPGQYPSLFSGLYKILAIKNNFANGKFEQTLKLVRIMNSDFITNSAPATNANGRPATGTTGTSQNNQNSTNSTVVNTSGTSTSTVVQNTVSQPFATSGIPLVDVNNPVVIAPTSFTLNPNALINGVQARK